MLNEVIEDLEQAIEKAQASLKRELAKLRTGRAHAGMLDSVRVDYYGQTTPLPQMATVAVPEPRMLTVKPWEKDQIKNVERALRESDLGLNPQVDGLLIRVPIPPLTEERRRDLVKVVRAHAETARVALRNVRREALGDIKDLLKEKMIAEDDERRGQDEIQKLTDRYGAMVDALLKDKEAEIMEF
jgi:ribosome recycling factor